MSLPVAWITGAGGFIGSHLAAAAARWAPEWRVVPLLRQTTDLADFGAVARRWVAERPDAVLHAAALSRAAACQADPARAALLNVEVTRRLCELAAAVPLVFLSTDLVFDGRRGHYREADAVNPLSVYSETKVRAEQVVLSNAGHSVVRLSLNTGLSPTGDRSFTEGMRRAAAGGQPFPLFTDEFRTPLPVTVTARAIWELITRRHPPGLYHLAGADRLSRWEIGQLVAARWPGLSALARPASLRDYAGPPRPADTSLDSAKLQALLSFALPGLRSWMQENPGEPV